MAQLELPKNALGSRGKDREQIISRGRRSKCEYLNLDDRLKNFYDKHISKSSMISKETTISIRS